VAKYEQVKGLRFGTARSTGVVVAILIATLSAIAVIVLGRS